MNGIALYADVIFFTNRTWGGHDMRVLSLKVRHEHTLGHDVAREGHRQEVNVTA